MRPGACPPYAPTGSEALAAWGRFLAAAVDRYGPNGSFWALHPELPRLPIRAWQIWNEQNSPTFFRPRPNVRAYAELLAAAHDAIAARDPGARDRPRRHVRHPARRPEAGDRRRGVPPPALPPARGGSGLRRCRPAPLRRRGSTASSTRSACCATRSSAPATTRALWITELGWASGGLVPSARPRPPRPGGRLRRAFRYFLERRRRMGIEAVAWYSWRDSAPAASAGALRLVPALRAARAGRNGASPHSLPSRTSPVPDSLPPMRALLGAVASACLLACGARRLLGLGRQRRARDHRSAGAGGVLRGRPAGAAHRRGPRPDGAGQGRDAADRRPLGRARPATPKPDDPDFSSIDPVVLGAAAAGSGSCRRSTGPRPGSPRISTATTAATPAATFAPHSPEALAAWKDFVGALVERYGPDGTLWEGHPDVDAVPVRDLADLERAELAHLLSAQGRPRRLRGPARGRLRGDHGARPGRRDRPRRDVRDPVQGRAAGALRARLPARAVRDRRRPRRTSTTSPRTRTRLAR